jgi:polysaccharide deacetylase 2 family uncharacterized protein YibQ
VRGLFQDGHSAFLEQFETALDKDEMAKQKGRNRKRTISPLMLLIVASVSLLAIVLLWMFLGSFRGPNGIFTPLYEEVYSSSQALNKRIKEIDYAIYESLYESGIQEKNVYFLSVQPRHQNGYVWDFAELLVKCPDNNAVIALSRIINRDLTALGGEVTLRTEKGPDNELACHVYIDDFKTHRIFLSATGHRPASGDTRPKLAIIVDDLGYDSDTDLSFFLLDLPLSFSVLPYGPFTRSVVHKANQKGYELILHLPMEPKNYPSVKPGPGGLFLSMDANEIRQVLDQNLRRVSGVHGVNNHMGSSFTENREKMLVVLKELKKRGLFFVDSRTTKHTVALDLARRIGLPAARRRVFLDNNLEPKALKIQMERLLSMARHRGSAIGICHPYKETYQLLKRYRSKIKTEFQIVPVSELVR